MAFTVAPVTSLKVEIPIEIPLDAGSLKKTLKAGFVVEFRKRPVSEQQALIEELKTGKHEIIDDDVLVEDIINIEGLKDTNEKDLEYSPELLATLLEMDYVRAPLMEAWMGINFGGQFVQALKTKN